MAVFRSIPSRLHIYGGLDFLRTQRWKTSVALGTESTLSSETSSTSLVELHQARLSYPISHHSNELTRTPAATTPPINLSILPPEWGGHALLGPNASAKSLICQAIIARGHGDFLNAGSFQIPSNWMSNAISHVSFDSHQQLLEEGGTTYRAISQGGTLSKAAQFLIVRFGLYPLLERDLRTLSTGEIRKVMLVRALSTRPKLLVLDNAFDGLDVASRDILKDLVKKTILGFTQDILVQGIDSKATAHTQILLVTHRAEEIIEEIKRISHFGDCSTLKTIEREGKSGTEIMETALNVRAGDLNHFNWEDESLPSENEIAGWWCRNNDPISSSDPKPIVISDDVSIKRGDTTLLHSLHWKVLRGQRWLVGGGNGAGKSTLSRLLVRPEKLSGFQVYGRVGWVSTELHMETANSDIMVEDLVASNATSRRDDVMVITKWLGVADTLHQRFNELSQGQQKLVLIATAIVGKPDVLVLDEPCQGLDGVNRQRVLALIERLCRATDMSLVYITHHLEELIPSITDVLHLKERRDVYNGPVTNYRPEEL